MGYDPDSLRASAVMRLRRRLATTNEAVLRGRAEAMAFFAHDMPSSPIERDGDWVEICSRDGMIGIFIALDGEWVLSSWRNATPEAVQRPTPAPVPVPTAPPSEPDFTHDPYADFDDEGEIVP